MARHLQFRKTGKENQLVRVNDSGASRIVFGSIFAVSALALTYNLDAFWEKGLDQLVGASFFCFLLFLISYLLVFFKIQTTVDRKLKTVTTRYTIWPIFISNGKSLDLSKCEYLDIRREERSNGEQIGISLAFDRYPNEPIYVSRYAQVRGIAETLATFFGIGIIDHTVSPSFRREAASFGKSIKQRAAAGELPRSTTVIEPANMRSTVSSTAHGFEILFPPPELKTILIVGFVFLAIGLVGASAFWIVIVVSCPKLGLTIPSEQYGLIGIPLFAAAVMFVRVMPMLLRRYSLQVENDSMTLATHGLLSTTHQKILDSELESIEMVGETGRKIIRLSTSHGLFPIRSTVPPEELEYLASIIKREAIR